MKEKRKYLRVEIDARVVLRKDQDETPGQGIVKNLSGNGILISVDRAFEPGDILELEVFSTRIEQPVDEQPIKASIRVIRVDGQFPPFELAASFINLELP